MNSGGYRRTLRRKGFKAFLCAQFLGAFSDNVYKMVVSLLAADLAIESGAGSGYLSLALFVFTVPFLLFSGYAGYAADVYSKSTVLIVAKSFEILAMILATAALVQGTMFFLLLVLFLTAVQSTFFSPAKYGILPEVFPTADLSRANGVLEMTTFLAIIAGTSTGAWLFAVWKEQLVWVGGVLVGVALVGTLACLGIPRVAPSGALKPFRLNPWSEIGRGVARIIEVASLRVAIIGISYFWFMGALLHMAIILLGKEMMALGDIHVGLLIAFLGIGIGIGTVAAGWLSGDRVELGLVPAGAAGVGMFLVLLYMVPHVYPAVGLLLLALGISSGFFIVPLDAHLQARSGEEEKGTLIGSSNFFNMGGVILASGALWTFRDVLDTDADSILLVFGLLTIIATVVVLAMHREVLTSFLASWARLSRYENR